MEHPTSLELKLLHGKGISAFNFFQKLNVYAAASISSDDPKKKLDDRAQTQRTPADKEGDGSPEWKHELRFDLAGIEFRDSDDVFLRVDLFHEGVMFGDKHIGEVRVPIRDLIEQPGGLARFVSYQVKGVDGKPNGVLSFSYRVNGVGEGIGIGSIGSANGITGYVVSHHHHQNQENQDSPPANGNLTPATTLYPTLGEDAAPSAPPLETQYPPPGSYYPEPEGGYYPLPPPPPPSPPPLAAAVMYPPPPGLHGAGYYYHHGPPPPPPPRPLRPPPLHHYHSWGHGYGPYNGGDGGWGGFQEGEAWRGTSWNGR